MEYLDYMEYDLHKILYENWALKIEIFLKYHVKYNYKNQGSKFVLLIHFILHDDI